MKLLSRMLLRLISMPQRFKQKKLLKLALEGKIHPKGVDFVFSFTDQFFKYCKILHIKPSTANIVEHFSRIVVASTVYLSDIYLEQIGITSYQTLGEIIDTGVKLKVFNYHEGDSLNDFRTDRDLLSDVRATFSSYPELIDLKLNDGYTRSTKS